MVINGIDDFLEVIRSNLENYCLQICPSKCCTHGKIYLKKEELDAISPNNNKDIVSFQHLYELNLTARKCPKLNVETKLCEIFTDKNRPQMCKDFPFFLRYKTLFISEFCPATRFLITSKTEEHLLAAGIKVVWQ